MEKNKAPKKWTEEEEKQLLNEISEKKKISEISKIHDRSTNAISMRACDICIRLIQSGKTIEESQQKINIVSINEIESYIKREKQKKDKDMKKENVSDKTKEDISLDTINTKLNMMIEKMNQLQNDNNIIFSKIEIINEKISSVIEKTKHKSIKTKA